MSCTTNDPATVRGKGTTVLAGAIVHIDSPADASELADAVRRAVADGPFVLADVTPSGVDRHRCTFERRRPDLALGYRHVIDLQHRLDRAFHLVGVEAWRAEPLVAAS